MKFGRFLAASLLSTGFAMSAIVAFASPAHADTAQATAIKNCETGRPIKGATFTISPVEAAPNFWVNTTTQAIDVTGTLSGDTATYNVTLNEPIESAMASVPDGWTGTFVQTDVKCAEPAVQMAPVLTVKWAVCGQTQTEALVENKNPGAITYTFKLGSQTKSVPVTGGDSGQAVFTVDPTQAYTVEVEGNGQKASQNVEAHRCDGKAPAGAPAKKTTSSGKTDQVVITAPASASASQLPPPASIATEPDDSINLGLVIAASLLAGGFILAGILVFLLRRGRKSGPRPPRTGWWRKRKMRRRNTPAPTQNLPKIT